MLPFATESQIKKAIAQQPKEESIDIPTPTIEDAGKAIVVDDAGKFALGEVGGSEVPFVFISEPLYGKTIGELFAYAGVVDFPQYNSDVIACLATVESRSGTFLVNAFGGLLQLSWNNYGSLNLAVSILCGEKVEAVVTNNIVIQTYKYSSVDQLLDNPDEGDVL